MTDPRRSLRERGFLTPDHRLTQAGIAERERLETEIAENPDWWMPEYDGPDWEDY